ncbi:MAG: transferase, partial [Phototrophicales bacterium]
TPSEFKNGHVPGAINIPLDQLQARIDEIPTDKPIVVICASGNRSQTGAKRLANAGYDRVYNLKGGTMSWMMAGLPIE